MIATLVLLTACSNGADSSAFEKATSKKTTTEKTVNARGGEQLLSVRAEYSYCYSTGDYDPTNAYDCAENITYKECLEWKAKEPGEAHTFFYATFMGGEPTIPGRYANEYYMRAYYGDKLEQETDEQAAFPEMESEFSVYDLTDCYPKGTMEIYNVDDDLMAKMSFDNTEN